MDITPKLVDTVVDSYMPEDHILTAVRERSRQANLPEIEVSAQQGRLLTLLVQMSGAKRVLEIGTLGGYSTVCLARGLGYGGMVTSLEYQQDYADIARENLKLAHVSKYVEIIVGPALETLPLVQKDIIMHGHRHPEFDFVFIDADKENNGTYVDWAIKLGRVGTIILVDNVIRDGRVLTRPEKLVFIQDLAHNSRLDVSVIQTVGSKGWDGFVLARITT